MEICEFNFIMCMMKNDSDMSFCVSIKIYRRGMEKMWHCKNDGYGNYSTTIFFRFIRKTLF